MSPIRVALVDDHLFFREGIKVLVRSKLKDQIAIVGEASDGFEAVTVANQLNPDVVLMDIQMPGMDGIRATRALKRRGIQSEIIGLSTFNDNTIIDAMLAAGAKGFLLKNTTPEELLRAILTVYSGGYHITQDSFLERQPNLQGPNLGLAKKDGLTERELDIIRLICQELTNKEIASSLHIDVRSVETHRENIMKKLGLKNGIGIAVYAGKAGII